MRDLSIKFFKSIECLPKSEYGKHFLEYILSPVITGIKPASTVTLRNCRKELRTYWETSKKEILDEHSLEYIELENDDSKLILLVYDSENLYYHLNLDSNARLLCQFGYNKDIDLGNCLLCLKNRIDKEQFPHESGVFLGIPSEDVLGFINHKDSIYDGFWKVYKNINRYKYIFNLYNRSKKIYIQNYFSTQKISIKDIYSNHRKSIYANCG